MAKVKNFEQDFPSTEIQDCDGKTRHQWQVITAVRGASAKDVSGLCWCRTCGAMGRWNNDGLSGAERVTEISLPDSNPNEF